MAIFTDRMATASPASSHYSQSSNGLGYPDRPDLNRTNTSNSVLDYYTSSIADGAHGHRTVDSQIPLGRSHLRHLSSDSGSSVSQYSSESEPEETVNALPSIKKRKNSQGAGDRRRLHIIEMQSKSEDRRVPSTMSDTGHDRDPHSRNSLRVRRNADDKLNGLALVAPPDATPSSYRNLTATTPLATLESLKSWDLSLTPPHQRSYSEATSQHGRNERTRANTLSPQLPTLNFTEASPPRIQKSHSSNRTLDNIANLTSKSANSSALATPEIGQEKGISVPVAPPVIVQVTSGSPAKSQSGSPSKKHTHAKSTPSMSPTDQPPRLVKPRTGYLNYEPGLHATAGPLPPPPEPSTLLPISPYFSQPPPRPPRLRSPSPSPNRDLNAVKQALQLPASVTAKLSTPSSSPKKELPASIPEDPSAAEPIHKREAGFSPSVFLQQKPISSATSSPRSSPNKTDSLLNSLLADVGKAMEEMKVVDDTDRSTKSPSTSDEYLGEGSQRPRLQHNRSWTELPPSLSRHSPRSEGQPSSPPLPSITPSMLESTPSPPSKSSRHATPKATLKRDTTLPKIPTYAPSVITTFSDLYSSYTPSPPHSPKLRSEHRRVISVNPQAMYFADVAVKKTCLERSVGYAQKINELYLYDCGLGDWLADVQSRSRSQEQLPPRAPLSPASLHHSLGLHRQPSRSSLMSGMSEATFPTRPDASVATDLNRVMSHDNSLPTAAPLVPYPSLAPAQQRVHSSRSSVTSAASSTRSPIHHSNKAAAFFASLGRTTSAKKEKVVIGNGSFSSPPSNVLIKTPKPPIQIQNSPHVPGGPRALPGRQQRSQTIMISPPIHLVDNRSSVIARRPSLFTPPPSEKRDADPAFNQQVDKLQDLLPHVGRTILAGYLRRSGHDMLAIGQYLEDEKNGTIKAY